jgi:hypothetical protein
MHDHETTVRARHLGRELTVAMQTRGWNASDISTLLGWSPSKTSRVLSGKRCASRVDIAAFLALCRVVGTRRDELLDLCDRVYEPTWWQDFGDRPPIHLQVVADAETDATTLTTYHPAIVPVLLQAPDYARAILAEQRVIPAAELDQRVTHIQARQHLVDSHQWQQRQLIAFVEEHALTRSTDTEVMSTQVHHLLRLTVRPTITIRLLPAGIGTRVAMPFTLLESTELPPVACIEQTTCVGFLEGADTIRAYRAIITDLDDHALDEDTSRQRLTAIAESNAATRHPTGPTGIWASE